MDTLFDNVVNFPCLLDCTNSVSHVSDPFSIQTDHEISDTLENDNMQHPKCTISDEEITLAVDMPKRRAGRKKFKETRHPIYRGVRKRNSDKWVCEVREPIKQKRIWLGTYPTADMAARAHDVAALALKGQSATLNFADSVWRLHVPITNDPKDLRKAAIEEAEKFRPKIDNENGPICIEIDEFERSNVVANMAECPLFSPVLIGCRFDWDDMNDDVEVSLWSY